MKVVLNVKNMKTNEALTDRTILLWDATDKNWYITDKDALLDEFYSKSNKAIEEYDSKYNALRAEFDEFKQTFSEQYKQIVELMKILTEQERNK